MFYPYSLWLKQRYGEKVYKLPISLPISCPNRRNGQGGCSFCSELGTGFEAMDHQASVTEQMQHAKDIVSRRYKARKYIAYFQNYTNTFMPMDVFKEYLTEASIFPDIVEISVSTRPDCIRQEYLEWMAELRDRSGIQINIELGLQTANYHTLDNIHRGHSLAEYIDAMLAIRQYQFTTCTHLIANLPGDTLRDAVESARIVSVLHTDIVKIHSLYIARGTAMAEDYEHHRLDICSKEEYFERLRLMLENLSPDIAVERLFSRIPEKDALFCNWQTSWWRLKDEFEDYMRQYESFQGKKFNYTNGSALKGVFE
ncbi:MAG: TIGR01212 family radical SAM protein [Coprococcus sp.]